jgi:hypothetical protein
LSSANLIPLKSLIDATYMDILYGKLLLRLYARSFSDKGAARGKVYEVYEVYISRVDS